MLFGTLVVSFNNKQPSKKSIRVLLFVISFGFSSARKMIGSFLLQIDKCEYQSVNSVGGTGSSIHTRFTIEEIRFTFGILVTIEVEFS